ncbi:hypothetical protein JTB14_037501 [Gonioctena quinquepunctata]|nr:hypothetical protein JTB14_037501 [Gonioctena quinquepunctata]
MERTVKYETLFKFPESSDSVTNGNFLLVGNFNIPKNDLGFNYTKFQYILNFMQATESQQYNSITNSNNRKLDVVITNCEDCIVSKCDQPPVNIDAHHPALSISLNCRTPHINIFSINVADANKRFNFRKANFPVIYELIRTTDWRDIAERLGVYFIVSKYTASSVKQ